MQASNNLPSNNFEILYQDKNLIIVNKVSAISVLPDKTKDKCLKDFLQQKHPKQFYEAVHRLDRRTSGAVIFAKTKKSLRNLSEVFRNHQLDKVYWAVTEKCPEPECGTLRNLLIHDKRKNISRAKPLPNKEEIVTDANAKKPLGDYVELSYEVIGKSEHYFLLEIKPKTGKTHQIRAQLAAISCPIRGDLKYGAKRSTSNGLIMLHARSLSFEDENFELIEVVAPPPSSEPLWQEFVF